MERTSLDATRLGGSEIEWGIQVAFDTADVPPHLLPRSYRQSNQRYVPGTFITPESSWIDMDNYIMGNLPDGLTHITHMTSAGGRIYVDHGHPETSAAPSYDLDGWAAGEQAGAEQLFEAFEAIVADESIPISDFRLNKRVIDPFGESWGKHENHEVLRERISPGTLSSTQNKLSGEHREQFLVIALHLATRGMYAGSGGIVTHKNSSGQMRAEYVMSQKIARLTPGLLVHANTTGPKPLLNTRDSSHYCTPDKARLHIASADATVSPWATKMNPGPTKLILSALEAGLLPDPRDIPAVDPQDIAPFAQRLNRDLSCQQEHLTTLEAGEPLTGPRIQRGLYNMTKKYVEWRGGVSPDEAWTLLEWNQVLLKLENGQAGALADRADWPLRLKLITKLAHEHAHEKPDLVIIEPDGTPKPNFAHPDIINEDMAYDRMTRDPDHHVNKLRPRLKAWVESAPPAELVTERRTTPPPNTRGVLLGKLASNATIRRLDRELRPHLNWGVLRIGSDMLFLSDAHAGDDPHLEALLQGKYGIYLT